MSTEELIRDPVLDSVRAQVVDSVDYLAKVGREVGLAACSRRVEGVTILFRRSAYHEFALLALTMELHDPSSSRYRHRLLREDVAALFGLAEKDIEKIVFWLQSQSLELIKVSPVRTSLSFAGDLRTIEAAFRTQFHRYRVEGRECLANADACSIPAAFSTVISGLHHLSCWLDNAPPRRGTLRSRKSHKMTSYKDGHVAAQNH